MIYYANIDFMSTVTLPKSEYDVLKAQASAYERLLKAATKESVVTPPTRSKVKVLNAFKRTKKYNKDFLASLKTGLKRSAFFTEK